ncbi:unnamed protein product, partial [Amoebophrya sp. A25]
RRKEHRLQRAGKVIVVMEQFLHAAQQPTEDDDTSPEEADRLRKAALEATLWMLIEQRYANPEARKDLRRHAHKKVDEGKPRRKYRKEVKRAFNPPLTVLDVQDRSTVDLVRDYLPDEDDVSSATSTESDDEHGSDSSTDSEDGGARVRVPTASSTEEIEVDGKKIRRKKRKDGQPAPSDSDGSRKSGGNKGGPLGGRNKIPDLSKARANA